MTVTVPAAARVLCSSTVRAVRAVRAAAVFDAAPRTTSSALAFDPPHAVAANAIATVHRMSLVRMVVLPRVSA